MSTETEISELIAELFDRHAQNVLRFARRRLDDESAAWDVVSETFLAAWRHAERCPSDGEERLPWLYAIAGNAVRTAHRTDVRRARLLQRATERFRPGASPDPAEEVVAADAVVAALTRLSDVDREVLRLIAFEELPDGRTIGLALGVSPATAAVRIHRARQRLYQQLTGTNTESFTTTTAAHGDTSSLPTASATTRSEA